jgi:hypothetical protein
MESGSGASLALYSPSVAEHYLLDRKRKTIWAIGAAGAVGEMQARIERVAELKMRSLSWPTFVSLIILWPTAPDNAWKLVLTSPERT